MKAPRLAVVSYLGCDPFTPRGMRTRALVEALGRDCTIELHSAPSSLAPAPQPGTWLRHARKVIRMGRERVLLDKQEIWSYLHFRAWKPKVDGALLVGLPMSPLVYASACLYTRGIPYVVDVGDPWMLTHPNPVLGRPVASRASRAERRLWASASGAVVTTTAQADAILSLYPAMPVLVRPNGYETPRPANTNDPAEPSPELPNTITKAIRLVHFGDLSTLRLDVSLLLRRLVDSRHWREVRFAQYGSDWDAALDRVPSEAVITRHKPVRWEEAVVAARKYDAAIVIGNRNSYQMPSKAVQYLTLPIPRVALTSGADDDALAQYVADKAGWLCSAIDDPQLVERLHYHLSRNWSAAELAPPISEAWPRVATEIAVFVSRVLSAQAPHSPSTSSEKVLSSVSRLSQ
jgi:hypothetical protein